MASLLAILSFFISPIGRYIAIGVISLSVAGGAYIKGDLHGRAIVQAKWDAAVADSIKQGEEARKDAEQYVATETAPATGFSRLVPQRLRSHDRYDGDRGAVRAVPSDNVPLPKGHPVNGAANPSAQPSGSDAALLGVSCQQVQWAAKNFPPDTLAFYKKNMTPAQAALSKKCLKGKK